MTAPDRIPRSHPELRRDRSSEFDELVRQQYAGLCQFIYRYVGSQATAEDLVQDLFLSLWQRRDKFDFADPLPYLYRAARNRALSHLRDEKVRDRWRQGASAAPPELIHQPSDPDAGNLLRALDLAVEALPQRCRLIFTLSREQGLSYKQIASLLGISIKTVETQMGRALRVLRSMCEPYL